MEDLFVYGTLLDPHIQKKVLGRFVPGEPDTLVDYIKVKLKLTSGVYPIIKPEAGRVVEGVVLTVTPAELKLIDHYETDAYRRIKVVLASGRRAWVYQL